MGWDSISDQQIESCFSSEEFQNRSILYFYEDQNWELRIVFNPNSDKIIVNEKPCMFQFYYGVFSKDTIPKSLESHLREIIKEKLGFESGGFWSISSSVNGKLSIDYFADATSVPKIELAPTHTEHEDLPVAKESNKKCTNADLEISNLFTEQTFRKLSLKYEWNGVTYPVHVLHNPVRDTLYCNELKKPVKWAFAITIDYSSYPLSLANHLKSIIPNELLKDSDSVIDVADRVSYRRKNSVSLYTNLHPITLFNKIDNPDFDVEILDFFNSSQLARKALYYELDGNFYRVYLIFNPEKLTLRATLSFDTSENGRLSHTASWNSKIGIFVDKKAPQELIDHLSHLVEFSWWDSYWNMSIHNGDRISVTRQDGSWEYTYTPFSWCTYMVNAKL